MSNPVRMCIVCRGRFLKSQLICLQYKEEKLIKFSGVGRSFYVCRDCVDNKVDNNKIVDCIIKTCKIDKGLKENLKQSLKEIFVYG
ncbi:YlxR family protein [Helicobacter mesocricetorum]|uniref:DUF448 domain-containing protein n=1 Tax=Helicobacter mesocricetorum TaxID=87012 RepID=UPI000CF1C6D3|nr:DUF448 domain-containing protein [Helicobacter mesocricetorum]